MGLSGLLKILTVNLKHNSAVHIGMALVIAWLTGVVFNITALDYRAAAQPLEMFLPFVGVILLVPVFLPEENEAVRDIMRTKKISCITVCVIRVIYSVIFLALITGGFVAVMKLRESDVTAEHFIAGFTSAMALGTAGFITAGITKNTTLGYMVSFVYFIISIALKDKLGIFYLASMYAGGGTGKFELLTASGVMLAATFVIMYVADRKR